MNRGSFGIFLLIAFLAGACTSGTAGEDGPDGPTRDELIQICEDSRECSLSMCTDEATAWVDLTESEPTWEQSCSGQCVAEGCADTSQSACEMCTSDCEAARQAERDEWRDAKDAAADAWSACYDACTLAPRTSDEVTYDDCALGRWDLDPAWCAALAGAQIVDPAECSEVVPADAND